MALEKQNYPQTEEVNILKTWGNARMPGFKYVRKHTKKAHINTDVRRTLNDYYGTNYVPRI